MERGTVWWAELPQPVTSEPGFRRPVVIVQANAFNRSRLRAVMVIVLTSNLRLADAPGNVSLPAGATGLPKDSVANVSQVITIDKAFLAEQCGGSMTSTIWCILFKQGDSLTFSFIGERYRVEYWGCSNYNDQQEFQIFVDGVLSKTVDTRIAPYGCAWYSVGSRNKPLPRGKHKVTVKHYTGGYLGILTVAASDSEAK